MRVKLALAGKGGGARPPTIASKVAVYASAEWADTLTLFHLYSKYMYSVVLPIQLSAGAFNATVYVMVDIIKGSWLHQLGLFLPS